MPPIKHKLVPRVTIDQGGPPMPFVDPPDNADEDAGLLGEYADILAVHGPESRSAVDMLQRYADNEKFQSLARTYLVVWKRINGVAE